MAIFNTAALKKDIWCREKESYLKSLQLTWQYQKQNTYLEIKRFAPAKYLLQPL